MSTRSHRLDGVRSKTGCITCKIRRVKCGEEKPRCYRCSSTGRRCDYAIASSWASKSLSPDRRSDVRSSIFPLSDLSSYPSGQRERRAFEYYFHRAAPALSGVLDSIFWRGTVLQICRSEPAIWDAIIALSALYERPPITDCPPFSLLAMAPVARELQHLEALSWYSRSLESLQKRFQKPTLDPAVALLSCLLFITIELLQGNMSAAVTLYRQGMNMIANNDALVAGTPRSTISSGEFQTVVAPVFARMGALTLILAGVAPIQQSPADIILNQGFSTLTEARTALYTLLTAWKLLNQEAKQAQTSNYNGENQILICNTLYTQKQALESRLLAWHRAFQTIKPDPTLSSTSHSGVSSTLQMTYLSILIETRTCLAETETDYIAHESDFAHILSLAPAALAITTIADGDSQPPFTFEMGVGLPLFITALKCRSPALRREALRYLRLAPPVQSLYMCRPSAHVVAALVSLEEELDPSGRGVMSLEEVLGSSGRRPRADCLVRDFGVVSSRAKEGRWQAWLKYRRGCVKGGKWTMVLLPEVGAEA